MKKDSVSSPSQTDWERIDQMTDEDIDLSDVQKLHQKCLQHQLCLS